MPIYIYIYIYNANIIDIRAALKLSAWAKPSGDAGGCRSEEYGARGQCRSRSTRETSAPGEGAPAASSASGCA